MEDVIQQIKRHDRYDIWFSTTSSECNLSDYIDNGDSKIPLHLLYSDEAVGILDNHTSKLMKAETRKERRKAFMSLLRRNKSVKAGKELADVSVFFTGDDCFDGLSMCDRMEVRTSLFFLCIFLFTLVLLQGVCTIPIQSTV